MSKKYL